MKTVLRWAERLGPGGSGLSILIFHRVLAQRDPLFPQEVCAEEFDALCGWLAQWCRVWPLQEAAARLQRGDLPPGSVCITFDDGYADNHSVALPILRRHGLCATFFVATAYLDGGRMWNDTVVETVRACADDALDVSALKIEGLGLLDLATPQQRQRAIGLLLGALKYREPHAREVAALELARLAGVQAARLPVDLMMTSAQVADLHQAGMSIGAHTHRHPILAVLDESAALQEIGHSREVLEGLLREPVELFAYPNGRPQQDYSARDVSIVRRLGFKTAVSTRWGVARAGADGLQLPRYTPWDRSRWRFGLRMARQLLAA